VPWDTQSNLIEVSYPKGQPEGNEGVRLHLGDGPDEAEFLSFWVYPRLDKKSKRKITTLKFYFNNNFFEAELKTDIWQRIIVPLNKQIKAPYWGNICFMTDFERYEFNKGKTASFELNGFAVWGKNHLKKGVSTLKCTRLQERRDSLSFTFLGEPGSYAEYRYYFNFPVEFKDYLTPVNGKNEIVFRGKCWSLLKDKITALRLFKSKLEVTNYLIKKYLPFTNFDEILFNPLIAVISPYTKLPDSKVNLKYSQLTQCLELKMEFPDEHQSLENVIKMLPYKEKKLIEKNNLSPLTLKLSFNKIRPHKKSRKHRK
jgi:hypothetical protein